MVEQSTSTRRRGRPVRGAVAGFFLGLLISIDLVLVGAVPTNAAGLLVAPPVGLVLGIVVGRTAPFARLRRSRRSVGSQRPAGEPSAVEAEAVAP